MIPDDEINEQSMLNPKNMHSSSTEKSEAINIDVSGDTWHHSCWMSIPAAFRVVGQMFTTCLHTFSMVSNLLILKRFTYRVGCQAPCIYMFIHDSCRCLFVSLFLSLSLYIYICDHRLQQHVWGYACDLAFATNLRLVLKSSPNRFEHRERNLVLQVS